MKCLLYTVVLFSSKIKTDNRLCALRQTRLRHKRYLHNTATYGHRTNRCIAAITL